MSAGRLRVQVPSGPPFSPGPGFKDASVRIQPNQAPGALQIAGANSAWCSSNILRSGRRERECKSPRAVHFSRSVAQSSERPAWDREAAGGDPAVPTSIYGMRRQSATATALWLRALHEPKRCRAALATGLHKCGRHVANCFAAVTERQRHSSPKRADAGATPAGSANPILLSRITVVHPPVKRDGAGATPA